jgi:adenylate cyclase
MVEAVFNHEGTLDKFIGDALMAVFGAPLPLTQNHGWMAVKSALDMRWRLAAFNEKRIRENHPLIHIGIGISSGEVVSGTMYPSFLNRGVCGANQYYHSPLPQN